MRAKRVLLFGLAGLMIVFAVAVASWFRFQREQWFAAAVPARPDLSGWPAGLQARIADSERRSLQGSGRVAALGELASLYHANGFHAEAAVAYAGLLRLDAGNPRWPHRLAHVLAGFGRAEEAISLWQKVEDLAPGFLPARLRLGDALLKSNRVEEAGRVYEAVIALEPRNAYALLGLARIDIEAERWAEARDRLEAVVRLSDYGLGYDILPTVCEKLGDEERARAIRGREKASGAYRDAPDPWLDELAAECFDVYRLLLLAGAAGFAQDNPTAERLFARALQLAPEDAPVHYQVGIYFLNRREYTRARSHLEQCVRLAPDFADGWASLAFLCGSVGDAPGAERALSVGLQRCPTSPGLHLDRGRRRAAAGRFEEAIEDFQRSAQLRPEDPDAYVDLARVLIKLQRSDEAAVALQQALRVEPGHVFALTTLAIYSTGKGDEAAARKWIREMEQQPRVSVGDREAVLRAFSQRFGRPPE